MPRPLLAFVALGLAACGHPATTEECDAIFRRSAEIELEAQGVRDPTEVDRRIEEARVAKGDELLKKCVGQRITERSMRCVRGAKSAEDIEKCLK
jgi:hypothetical protein